MSDQKQAWIGYDGEPVAVGDFVEIIDPRTGRTIESGAVGYIDADGLTVVRFLGVRQSMFSFDRPRDSVQISHRYLRVVHPHRTPIPDAFRDQGSA